MLPYIVTILGAYLIGCSNMALYLSRWKGVNLRAGGSKNLGASNAFALMGWKAGLLVAVHDIGKAVLAVELSKWIFPAVPLLGFIAGVACVLGHMFPFYLKFKGGKGVATVAAMILTLDPPCFLILAVIFLLLVAATRYVSLGSVICMMLYPIVTYKLATHGSIGFPVLFSFIVAALIIFMHRGNIERLRNHTENKISFSKKDKKAKKDTDGKRK